MGVRRRPASSFVGPPPDRVAPTAAVPLTYRGYRIEPESYSVNSTAWSPRVVVAVQTPTGWGRRTPLYATSAVRFGTREEADRSALEVAKSWIDAEVDRR